MKAQEKSKRESEVVCGLSRTCKKKETTHDTLLSFLRTKKAVGMD